MGKAGEVAAIVRRGGGLRRGGCRGARDAGGQAGEAAVVGWWVEDGRACGAEGEAAGWGGRRDRDWGREGWRHGEWVRGEWREELVGLVGMLGRSLVAEGERHVRGWDHFRFVIK